MRVFNTSGPCDPAKHYTVMREALVTKGQALVDQGRYFTIFAPRQAGKTTYFQLLMRRLAQVGYTPIWISFESLKTIGRAKFYATVAYLIQRQLADHGIKLDFVIEDQVDLQRFFDKLREQAPAVVLVIDEFEDIPDIVLSELMHAFRALYQQKQYHALHAMMLVGVSTIAELVVSSASPFDDPIPFTVNEPNIAYLYANGVIDNVNGYVDIPVPLYSKALITALRPLINGESKHYVSAHDTFRDYVTDTGLNLAAILVKYHKRIYTYIILTNFTHPSRSKAPKAARVTRRHTK